MKAIRQYLVIKNIKLEPSKLAGLQLSIEDEDIRYFKGEVMSAGSIAIDEGIKEGDIVWYDRFAGHDQIFNDELYRIISLGDIVIVE